MIGWATHWPSPLHGLPSTCTAERWTPIAGLLGGKIATDFLREFLDSPEGKNLGILAIEPDITQLFANPPFPPFLNVSTAPWPEDLTAEQLVGFIQNSAENIADVQLHSVIDRRGQRHAGASGGRHRQLERHGF